MRDSVQNIFDWQLGSLFQSLDVQGILTLLLTLIKFLISLHEGVTVRSRPFKEVVSFDQQTD